MILVKISILGVPWSQKWVYIKRMFVLIMYDYAAFVWSAGKKTTRLICTKFTTHIIKLGHYWCTQTPAMIKWAAGRTSTEGVRDRKPSRDWYFMRFVWILISLNIIKVTYQSFTTKWEREGKKCVPVLGTFHLWGSNIYDNIVCFYIVYLFKKDK